MLTNIIIPIRRPVSMLRVLAGVCKGELGACVAREPPDIDL
jgi:hypothetical protein